MAPNEDTNMVFGDIVENCLIDVWQRTQLEIMDRESKDAFNNLIGYVIGGVLDDNFGGGGD